MITSGRCKLCGPYQVRRDSRRPAAGGSSRVRFSGYSFGSVRVDGVTYDHDLIIPAARSAAQEGRLTYVPRPVLAHPALSRRCADIPSEMHGVIQRLEMFIEGAEVPFRHR
jgi:hypothetical protein